MNLTTIRMVVGFGMKIFGIVWALMDKVICDSLCNGGCSAVQNNVCSLLLLFVGIIFVICGCALIIMKDKQKIKLKKKIKKNFEILK